MNMPMAAAGLLFPLVFGLIWLGLVTYLIVLATRFVRAVERIADDVGRRAGGLL